jgi:prepilin-type N-terminal cleavage/methylation domain-containing protein
MTRRVRDEDGFSLPEVLIAMTIMLIIMGATLSSLDAFRSRQKVDQTRADAQEVLRRGMDHLQRQLRNLATPQALVKSIDRAGDYDLVFQTADPTKRWVRYCVNPVDPLIATGRASLWYGVFNGATPPTTTTCASGGSWNATSAGTAIVSTRNGLDRPVFTYNWPKDGNGDDIVTDTSAITRVRSELWVDTNPGVSPVEQRLTSGVFLRNQNQAPVPRFTSTPGGTTAAGFRVILNASATTDFEGRRLNYYWYYGAAPAIPTGCKPATPEPPSYLGSGIVLEALFPTQASSPQSVTLCAIDPGDMQATLSKSVSFP